MSIDINEAELPRKPPTAFQRAISNIHGLLKDPTQGAVDWDAVQKQQQDAAQQQQVVGQRNDPAIRSQKYQILVRAFENALFSRVRLGPKFTQQVGKALENIAKSYTLGYQVRASDLHEILLTIHRSKSTSPIVKTETFPDHYRLLAFLNQVFDHHPETWWNPDARNEKERFPPNFSYNRDEMKLYFTQWKKNPFRVTDPTLQKANQPDPPQVTVCDEVAEMFKGEAVPFDVLKKFADAMFKRALSQGVKVDYGDEQKLRDIAHGGVGP